MVAFSYSFADRKTGNHIICLLEILTDARKSQAGLQKRFWVLTQCLCTLVEEVCCTGQPKGTMLHAQFKGSLSSG